MNQTAFRARYVTKRGRWRGTLFIFTVFYFRFFPFFCHSLPPPLVCVSQCCFGRQWTSPLATGVLSRAQQQSEGVRCAEVTRTRDRTPHRSGDKYSACVRVR
jgi:hypothetical protein